MSKLHLHSLLQSLENRGFIQIQRWPTIVTYHPDVWVEVAHFIAEAPHTTSEKYTLLYEGILAGEDGDQFSEHEIAEFLLKCAFGKESLPAKFLAFCERYVRDNCEAKLVDAGTTR